MLDPTYTRLHQELLDQDILQDSGNHALFVQSYGFSSASAAAAIVADRTAAGTKSWILKSTGQTYGEWEASSLASTFGADPPAYPPQR